MKKLIAMLSVLGLISSFATFVSAAPAETSIEPRFYIEKLAEKSDDDEFMYELKVDYVGDELTSTKKSGKYSGTAFTMIQVDFDHPEDDGIWAEGEMGTYTDVSNTLGQYLFQGGNGTYYAPATGDAILTIYTAGDIDVKDFVIKQAICTVDTFEKNVTSIQTNYSAAQKDIDNGVAHYLAYIGIAGGDDEPTPDPEPADPNKTAITATFTATTTDYVEVVLEDGKDVEKATNSYALPQGVKNGEAIVAGILKYTVDAAGQNGVAPVAGDIFKVYVKSIADSAKAVLILTEEVK